MTIITSWNSADDVQYINVDVILYKMYTGWQTTFMYIFVYNSTHQNCLIICGNFQNTRFLYESKNITFCKLPYLEGLVWTETWVHPPFYFQCYSTSRDEKKKEKERTEGGGEGEHWSKLSIEHINLLFISIDSVSFVKIWILYKN